MAPGPDALDSADPGHYHAAPAQESIGAADVRLGEADLAEIGASLAKIEMRGNRYPTHLQANIDR